MRQDNPDIHGHRFPSRSYRSAVADCVGRRRAVLGEDQGANGWDRLTCGPPSHLVRAVNKDLCGQRVELDGTINLVVGRFLDDGTATDQGGQQLVLRGFASQRLPIEGLLGLAQLRIDFIGAGS